MALEAGDKDQVRDGKPYYQASGIRAAHNQRKGR
jgi:hypothetical protein